MIVKRVFFTYNLEDKQIKDSKIFSISDTEKSIETIIYNHINNLYPNQVSQVSITYIENLQ